VHDLCPEMAVMAGGKVILQGRPALLTEKLRGLVWRKTVPRQELAAQQAAFDVISTRLIGGKIQLHVLSSVCPGEGFEQFDPGLEDVYFSALFGSQVPGKGGAAC